MMLLPIERFGASSTTATAERAARRRAEAAARRDRTRLKYLNDVGIGYLTLDRQSRTLSGGEVQRINLTTALGTSLVNTLFVLDEPSSACIRATCTASSRPCSACATPATRWWWSSTTRP
jgi:excinuclease ABC subunit A